jgi:hypothetical protein
MTEPVPPKNARLLVDDDVIPLELVYEGVDRCGKHSWRAAWPIDLTSWHSVKLACDELPDDATISIGFGVNGFEPTWGPRD